MESSVRLEDLIVDFSIYPRNDVSSQHVATLVDALQAGNPIPPLVVDRASKRIVDGVHRHKAYQKLKAESVPVVFKDYESEAELFADAVRLNAAHGRSFDSYDRRRAVVRLVDFGFKEDQIAEIVRVAVPRIGEFLRQTVTASGGDAVVIKAGLRGEFAGRQLTKRMEKLNESWSGMQPTFHVNQLIDLLKSGIVPKTENFGVAMDQLADLWLKMKKKFKQAS